MFKMDYRVVLVYSVLIGFTSALSQHQALMCNVQTDGGLEQCVGDLRCSEGTVNATRVDSSYKACGPGSRCDFCCQNNLAYNYDLTLHMYQQCIGKSTCGTDVLNYVSIARIWFTCIGLSTTPPTTTTHETYKSDQTSSYISETTLRGLSTTPPTTTTHETYKSDQTSSYISETTLRGSSLLPTTSSSGTQFLSYQVVIGLLSTVIVILLVTNVLTAIRDKRNMEKNKATDDGIRPKDSDTVRSVQGPRLWSTTGSSRGPVTSKRGGTDYIDMTVGPQYEDLKITRDVREQTYTDLEQ